MLDGAVQPIQRGFGTACGALPGGSSPAAIIMNTTVMTRMATDAKITLADAVTSAPLGSIEARSGNGGIGSDGEQRRRERENV